MTAVQTLLAAQRAGAQVSVRRGSMKLLVRSQSQLPPQVLAKLQEHRDRLVEILVLASPAQAPLCRPCGRPQHEPDYVCPQPSPPDPRFRIAVGYYPDDRGRSRSESDFQTPRRPAA